MILQTNQEQPILVKSKDATYSDVFERGPLLSVLVRATFNPENASGSCVLYVQSSLTGSTPYDNCILFELSASDPIGKHIITNTDTYLRTYLSSISNGTVDVSFDAVEA